MRLFGPSCQWSREGTLLQKCTTQNLCCINGELLHLIIWTSKVRLFLQLIECWFIAFLYSSPLLHLLQTQESRIIKQSQLWRGSRKDMHADLASNPTITLSPAAFFCFADGYFTTVDKWRGTITIVYVLSFKQVDATWLIQSKCYTPCPVSFASCLLSSPWGQCSGTEWPRSQQWWPWMWWPHP